MSQENQNIDPALLDDANPVGLSPNAAVNGGMSLKARPRGIKKLNKKGIFIAAGIATAAALVATTTFNGTGSTISKAAQDAAMNGGQGKNRPTEVNRDALWYASVPDKVTAVDPPAFDPAAPGQFAAPANAKGAQGTGPNGTVVPDLTGKAVAPFNAAIAPRTSAAPYNPNANGPAGEPGAPGQQMSQAEQIAQQQEAQAKQKKQLDMDQAMKAGLAAGGFGQSQAVPQTAAGGAGQSGFSPVSMNQPASALAQQRDDDPNKQERKDQFLKSQRDIVDTAYSSSRKAEARSQFELKAGGVIPAVLINGINSDLPGQVIGQVAENVYDSKTGKYLLIPQGTRIIGLYDAHVAYGQRRILLAWNRLIFPDGASFDLKGMPGADKSGYAGFFDQVDNHYVKIFGSAAILSLISAGVQLSQPNNGSNTINQPGVSQTLSGALGQQIGQTGMAITQKNLNIQPTLEVRPGYKFNIMVTADMILIPSPT